MAYGDSDVYHRHLGMETLTVSYDVNEFPFSLLSFL